MGTAFEEAMKARIKKGFNEWNGGYEGWLKWCNTLYEPVGASVIEGWALSDKPITTH